MVNRSEIKGIVPPIITPFDENNRIDEILFRKQIDFLIEHGVNGILFFDSSGEFYSIEEDEYKRGLCIAYDQVSGRVPVYCNIGATSTKKCVGLAKVAKNNGADAISVLQPAFVKPSEYELYYHFSAIAAAVFPMPMLLYNDPERAGYSLSKALISRLAHDVYNIMGIIDSSGDITLLEEIVRLTKDINFRVFGGKNTMIYGALVHGAVGIVSSASNYVPKLVNAIYNNYKEECYKKSFEYQLLLNPIVIITDNVTFPVGTKDIVKLENGFCGFTALPVKYTKDNAVLSEMQAELDKLASLGLTV